MTPRRLLAAGVASVLLAACAADSGVVTQEAHQSRRSVAPAPTTTEPGGPTSTEGPGTTEPSTSIPASAGELEIDEGDAKPERDYDEFLQAALDDIQRWWSDQFPALYGEPLEPLRGGVYAAYPERTDPIPGCGPNEETTYEQIREFAAFYCPEGDFLVYDDGEEGVLFTLAEQFGPTTLGVVMAHEYGHAIQKRAGILDPDLPTIFTEQQADCFAGAWIAHTVRGEPGALELTDEDVRVGLLAMISVRDPVGIDQFTEGGHGSAFDRVGAFQVGFTEGTGRCAELIENPLPLVPNVLRPGGNPGGNAEFGYGDGQIVGVVVNDLNDFWPQALRPMDVDFPALSVVPVESANDIDCTDPAGDLDRSAVYCAESRDVYFDEPFAFELYREFGDFSIGYLLGGGWSEAVQQALGSPLAGEERALLSDCLTGAWVKDIIPDRFGNTARGRAQIEAGDLDEAIRTALLIGDERSTDNVIGSGFEKIASFRQGVLDGLSACTARLPD